MRPAAVLAFLAAIFPLIATPGASFTLLVREVTARGRRRATPVVLGTVTGLYVHASLAIAGLSALVMHSSEAFEAVRLAGATYLIALGLHCWRAARIPADGSAEDQHSDSPRAGAFAAYRQAVLANVLNPKAASIFLTLVPQFLDPHRQFAAQILTLATAQSLLVCVWLMSWTAVLTGASRMLNSTCAKGVWKRATACVLICLGVRSAIS
jgi:threonine/homoserine/homoserine lactone efflux protein